MVLEGELEEAFRAGYFTAMMDLMDMFDSIEQSSFDEMMQKYEQAKFSNNKIS